MLPRRVVLGVTGGVAAYKACELLRRLRDRGFEVAVAPTENALRFVGSATWEALSGKKVSGSLWEDVVGGAHIELARAAELILIAPTTADFIARIAQGRSDDLLTATVLTAECPIIMIPAMHHQMWHNAATQENVKTLRQRGILVMEPVVGPLNNGDVGVGRFPETFEIFDYLSENGFLRSDLVGKEVVVTAGGTREMIDPVRFIGNLSSGKQGVELAKAAAQRGAHVTLVAANIEESLLPQDKSITIVKVGSAHELSASLGSLPSYDLLLMSAAVADYRPAEMHATKIKRDGSERTLQLVENPDVLATITRQHRATGSRGVIVGFAAESSIDLESAREKLHRKGVDYLFVNDVSRQQVFNSESNGGFLLSATGSLREFSYQSKDALSHQILDYVVEALD
jgi:phosphopantothenoylcysteine decarboxylase/phosphopantothenate--cysteine ligase